MTREFGHRRVEPGARLLELVVGAIAATLSLVLTSVVISWTQRRVADGIGHPIVDRGDEWHPLSMLVLLVVPAVCGYLAARSLRRRRDLSPSA